MVALGYAVDDIQRVTIAEAKPVGELRNPSFPESVGHEEEWEWSVEFWNVGKVAGDFRLRLTGDLNYEAIYTVEPESGIKLTYPGVIGPANFQIHLELLGWVIGDSYHMTVGAAPTATARAKGAVVASSDVAVDISESIEGVDFPGAEWRNPTFPSEVGPDEVWEGTMEAWNSGGKTGWFAVAVAEDETVVSVSPPVRIMAGTNALFTVRRIGPYDITWYLYLAEWTEADSLAVSVPQRTYPLGELRDLSIPKFGVGSGETWEGSVEAWNVGVATETFRLSVTGDITGTSESFDLAPREHTIVTWTGTGITPNGFTVTLQRLVGEEWVDDDSKSEVVGERITGYIEVMGYINVPPGIEGYYEQVPKAKVTLNGEQVLETSSLAWEPIHVASGRTYSLDITSRGYWHWSVPATWNEHRYRGYGHNLRNWFPIPG